MCGFELVTMTMIDAERVKANVLLDQVRSACRAAESHMAGPSMLREAIWLQRQYELQIEKVGRMLAVYHGQIDAAARQAMEAFR